MRFRIAAVSFLNTLPLVEWLDTQAADQVQVTRDLPSRLTAALQDGAADVALLPVAEILRGVSGGILPAGGIVGRGAVDSVKVFTTGDLSAIRRISADRGSRSSVALLRVLLAAQHDLRPRVTEVKPAPGSCLGPDEGLLVIGDRCFAYEKWLREAGQDQVRAWDLSQLWWDLTGLPFVFAIWAVAPGFSEQAGPTGVSALGDLLRESLRWGLDHRTELAVREAAAGSLGPQGYATSAAIDYYFRHSLCFSVGAEELAGIRRFQELAVAHDILPAGPMPPVL